MEALTLNRGVYTEALTRINDNLNGESYISQFDVTFPEGIKIAFAERMTATKRRTIAVKAITPDKTTPIINPLLFQAMTARRLSSFILLTCRPEERHIPEKHMNAIARRPTVMKTIPIPRSPRGTWLYSSFSMIPASSTMANAQPIPEKSP